MIGDEVMLGHGAIVHGCAVEKGALIGVGAVVDARTLVPEGIIVPPAALVLDVPAQVKPPRSDHRERAWLLVEYYVVLKALHQTRDANNTCHA